jgi:hypothetical protein
VLPRGVLPRVVLSRGVQPRGVRPVRPVPQEAQGPQHCQPQARRRGTDPITGSASQNIESQRNASITLALAGGQAAPSACMNEGREWRTLVVVGGVASRWGERG